MVGMVNTVLPVGALLLSVLLLSCANRGATEEVGNVSDDLSLSCLLLVLRNILMYIHIHFTTVCISV